MKMHLFVIVEQTSFIVYNYITHNLPAPYNYNYYKKKLVITAY